jgi:hypothetical protein
MAWLTQTGGEPWDYPAYPRSKSSPKAALSNQRTIINREP